MRLDLTPGKLKMNATFHIKTDYDLFYNIAVAEIL